MRVHTLIGVLCLALLTAGCGKRSGGGYSGTWSQAGTGVKAGRLAERSFPANGDEIKQAIANYLARPEVRIKEPIFKAISDRIPVKEGGGTVDGYWVQFTATNSYGDSMLRNHDLFLLKDGQVIAWYRTQEEIRQRLGTRWLDEHPTPVWPDVADGKKAKG